MSTPHDRIPPDSTETLESWKAIAAYLQRDISTVQRWEKKEGLPVHRHFHSKASSVYALRAELDHWRASRQSSSGRRTGYLVGGMVLLAAAFALGPMSRTRQPATVDILERRVWSGPDADRIGIPSPDGRWIPFTYAATGDVALRDMDSGTDRILTEGLPRQLWEHTQTSAVSPDGSQVAYAWFNDRHLHDLRLIRADGSQPRVLFQSPDAERVIACGWSADGRQVLAQVIGPDRRASLVLIDAASGSVRTLRSFGRRFAIQAAISADGNYVAYDLQKAEDSADREVHLLTLDGKDTLVSVRSAKDYLLGLSPSGDSIFYASDHTGTTDAWRIGVSGGRPAGAPELLKNDVGRIWPLGMTRRGLYYAKDVSLSDIQTAELSPALDRFASGPAALPRSAGGNRTPAWSPDGKLLAHYSPAPPGRRWADARVVMRGPDEREIWPEMRSVSSLRWCGDDLIASGLDGSFAPGLYRVNPRTGAVQAITRRTDSLSVFHELECTPDRKQVFFKLRRWFAEPSPLLVRDLVSGTEREVLAEVYRFALSADGETLAYSKRVDARSQGLFLMPAEGGASREVCRMQGQISSIAWSRDGRVLLFARRDELWRVAVAGGAAQKVASVAPNLHELRLHPDGRRIAFTAGVHHGEVWVMENTR